VSDLGTDDPAGSAVPVAGRPGTLQCAAVTQPSWPVARHELEQKIKRLEGALKAARQAADAAERRAQLAEETARSAWRTWSGTVLRRDHNSR
jgi:hypothetical protein